jgi:hypothetical protein
MSTALLVTAALVGGCNSHKSVAPVTTESRPNIQISDLPKKFLEPIDTTSESSIKAALKSRESLTLDGTTLTVGPVGGNSTVTLAFDTLTMTNHARIITNGNNLSILATNLAFNNNDGIASFVTDTPKPAAAAPGSDGGKVEIYSTNPVDGSLRIFLPGQVGGDGIPGADGAPGTQGRRGDNGVNAMLSCARGGTDGAQGNPGAQGAQGGTGGPGGNGGNLVLQGQAVTSHESHFPYQAAPGAGGAGGAGGGGGAGGPGGEGGSGSTYCGGGHGGPPGTPGLHGPPGQGGDSGKSSGSLKLE